MKKFIEIPILNCPEKEWEILFINPEAIESIRFLGDKAFKTESNYYCISIRYKHDEKQAGGNIYFLTYCQYYEILGQIRGYKINDIT